MSLDKPLDTIIEADLKALVDAGTPELKTLEYKATLPEYTDGAIKEFLADVSSFANAAGGHLIYGMRAEAGVPVELVGLQEEGDPTILRLENMIRDGIAPRIPGIHSFAVKLADAKIAIVVRIPKSFASPHMVKFRGTSRFFTRTSNGKSQLDVGEIRAAFLGSETTEERIRAFRLDRLGRVRARETSIPLPAGPCAVLHVIPVAAFGGNMQYDVIALKQNVNILTSLAPLFWEFADNSRINFDGLLISQNFGADTPSPGFTQIYRNGVIEATDAAFLKSMRPVVDGMNKTISGLDFENNLFTSTHRFLSVLKSLGVEPPLLITLALIDFRGYTLTSQSILAILSGAKSFDRDVLLPQEILLDAYPDDISSVMKPLVDQLWNAAGLAGSPFYKNGKWIGNEIRR